MLEKLTNWYRILSLEKVPTTILESRVQALDELTAKKINWIFNCIRLFLDKPLDDVQFYDEFVKSFTEKDPSFKQSENKLELRILAGALLYRYIDTKKTKEKNTLALALKTALFKVPAQNILVPDLVKYVESFLYEESIKNREQQEIKIPLNLSAVPKVTGSSADEINKSLNTISLNLGSFYNSLEKYNSTIHKRIDVLEEESNIYWWLLNGFSDLMLRPIVDIDPKILPFIIGKELSDLVRVVPGPVSAVDFLAKTLIDCKQDPCREQSLFTCLKALKSEIPEHFFKDKSPFGNLSSLNLAYSNLQDIPDNQLVDHIIEISGIDISKPISLLEISTQTYFEHLLYKSN